MYAAEAEYLAAGGPGTASFDLLAPFFAPDVELHQADALPYRGTWRGHNGMTQFFLRMGQVWESFEMVEQEFLATDETAVVLSEIEKFVGLPAFDWNSVDLKPTHVGGRNVEFEPDARVWLTSYYREHNGRLEELLGRTFPWTG